MRPINAAAFEESRHIGLAFAFGLPCLSATARTDGSGAGMIELLPLADLRRLYAVDPTVAVDVVTSYLAVALVGGDVPSPTDRALAAQALYLYRAICGRSAEAFELRAEMRATKFCLSQQDGIRRFASELASTGYLAGERLQVALARCFRRERQPVPTSGELGPWLATRRAEQEAAAKVEARAARLAQIARFNQESPIIYWR